MNLLLLAPEELREPGLAAVAFSRHPPRTGLWPPAPGRRLRVGLRDGLIGEGTVEALDAAHALIRFTLDVPPPPALPLALVLALPRPKMLRRVLRGAAELGIKQIWLVNAWRVDKSYWQSPLLAPAALDSWLRDGLEQAIDTVLPTVALRPRLRPFVEDELPEIASDTQRIIAHPAAAAAMTAAAGGRVTLAIGPEGGFSEFELQLFRDAGFSPASLGARVLRVETALPVLAANLFPATHRCTD